MIDMKLYRLTALQLLAGKQIWAKMRKETINFFK